MNNFLLSKQDKKIVPTKRYHIFPSTHLNIQPTINPTIDPEIIQTLWYEHHTLNPSKFQTCRAPLPVPFHANYSLTETLPFSSNPRNNPDATAASDAGWHSGSGNASTFGRGLNSNTNASKGRDTQDRSGTSTIEEWKRQSTRDEPWTPIGKKPGRSLGGLGSFVGYHGEVVDGKKR